MLLYIYVYVYTHCDTLTDMSTVYTTSPHEEHSTFTMT